MAQSTLLVTSALPYANGDIHLGYILEAVQSDVWVRLQRQLGHKVTYVCGEDAHGAGVMLKASELGISEVALCEAMYKSHKTDLDGFGIGIDQYHTTHSDENRHHVERIYKRLKAAGAIITQTKQQLFDPVKGMFLADRFVKGSCPNCQASDQYGDNCENCGSTYEASELLEPRSVFSGTAPELRSVKQLYFDLPRYQNFLEQWLEQNRMPSAVRNKLAEWLEQGIKPWDISREAPYFGFEIPGHKDKYFYVWLDAPIGYMASYQALCDRSDGEFDFDKIWSQSSTAELYHFIGKDIINFHGLFWPAMLHAAQHRLPTQLVVHGYVTINGQKMSKSRGTFILARTYLEHFDPDFLRYYFCSKLSASVDDIDLNLTEFAKKVNVDLVGKVVNIASRCGKFIHQHFGGRIAEPNSEHLNLYQRSLSDVEAISKALQQFEYSKGCRLIMALADSANRHIDEHKPWATIKNPSQREQAHQVVSLGMNLFRIIITCLSPITVNLAHRCQDFLNVPSLALQALTAPLADHVITPFDHLLQRLDPKAVTAKLLSSGALMDQPTHTSSQPQESNTSNDKPKSSSDASVGSSSTKAEIKIDDFAKLDLRIVKVVSAEPVEASDKLLKLTVDIGAGEQRTIFAGMKQAYPGEQLLGRQLLALVNLKPRKMRFGTSEGMILGAGPGGDEIFVLSPDEGAAAGMQVS